MLRLAEDVDRPAVGDDEVLLRVHAAGVDRGAWHLMTGLPYPVRLAGYGLRAPRTRVRGRELAGRVEAGRPERDDLQPGDEVLGIARGMLRRVRRRPGRPAAWPGRPSLTVEQAAAVPISGLTALQAVRDHGRVRRGQQVLVIGASGGVGTFAVQLAKAVGADGHRGVPHVQGGPRPVARRRPRRRPHPTARADAGATTSSSTSAGTGRCGSCVGLLTPRGTLVIVGGETGGRWLGGTDRQLRATVLSRFVGQRLGTFVNKENGSDLRELVEHITAGAVTPVLDRTFPLLDTATAIRYLVDGRARGKVVVTVGSP